VNNIIRKNFDDTKNNISYCNGNSIMTNNTKTTEQSAGSFYRQLLTCIGLCCFFFLVNYLWNSYTDSQVASVKPNVKRVSTTSSCVLNNSNSGVRIKKIQEVEVGERAIGTNPEVTNSERATFLPDPDPVTWRKLTLEMIKSDGKRLDITLLRPLSWLAESQANTGTTIFLDLPEMGAQGFAKVLNIEPCPPIKQGKGNVITGTFHHEAANTIDLHVEGLSKPIGCTDNHPFWSVTQNEFVEAGKLQQGEELHLYSGQTAKVIQILPRPGPEQVHNLEVLNEHVYWVTQNGVLVHNVCNGAVTIRNKSLAGKNHPVSNVPFNNDGFPDFSAHVQKEVKLSEIKGYADDFTAADKLAGITAEYRKANNLTWHHHQDCTTMQLIPSNIHLQTGHTGGLAIIKSPQ
jgi:hypothetical protein